MLDSQMTGKIDSWAIRWCYSQSKLDMYTVYPVKSKVKNIGLDGTGTHSGTSSKYNVELVDDLNVEFSDIEINQKILNRFQNHYGNRLVYYLRKIKRKLKI